MFVGLEAVAHGLVQQHPAEAVAHHHRQAPGGRVDGVEQGERPAGRLLGDLGRVGGDQLPHRVAPARVGAGLHAAVAARHDLGAEPHARAVVSMRASIRPTHRLAALGAVHAPWRLSAGRRLLNARL